MGRAVVLVHGFATSGQRTWGANGWVDLLQDSGRLVIVPDLPGHGDADKPHDPEAYTDMHRELLAVLPPEPVDAVGFSLGSRMLLTLASEQPERFHHLIVTATGEDLLRTHDYTSISAVLTGEVDPDGDPTSIYFRQLAQAPGNDPHALAAVMRRSTNRPLSDEQLANITCRVTVVVGDLDFAGPGEPLAERLPNASLVTVRGVDHFSTPKSFDVLDIVMGLLDDSAERR